MSKVKSPNKKKELSLERDRRNIQTFNSKASRKLIPRHKQHSHMGARRAVAQILSHFRKTAEDASETDILVKTELIERKRKAFKKSPDTPLSIVVKKKLQNRIDKSQGRQANQNLSGLNLNARGGFDTPYDSTLHKRHILGKLWSYTGRTSGWPRHKKKSQRYRRYERESATRWREATLRDAPLLVGFFTEEPQWRERLLRWCDAALTADSR
jgi:hypothetical protein